MKINVKLGTPDYPLEDAKDPSRMAHLIRANLTDDRRSIRIYGTQVVVARLSGSAEHLRIQLLNYDSRRNVEGIRVRVLGQFGEHRVMAEGIAQPELIEYSAQPDATEFTLGELRSYAVIDLMKR
jgi:hypothetical protein